MATPPLTLPSLCLKRPTSVICLWCGSDLNCSYPNQYSILDSFGTPCFIRADLRTSFLAYIMRTPNTRVRRYEFGNVMRMNRECSKSATQEYASIDAIWRQKWSTRRGVTVRLHQTELSVMYSWEAVLVSCQLLKSLSILLNRSLLLHVNHVGVVLPLRAHRQILSTLLEQYGIVDMNMKKQVVDKLRGLLKLQIASLSSTSESARSA